MKFFKYLLSKGTKSVISLNCVRFRATGFSHQGEHDGALVWHSPEGDGIGLYFFPVRPDIPENAMTGIREAVLTAQSLQNGSMKITPTDNGTLSITGEWNPDDERHDSSFPDHPISRVRRILSEITASIQIDPLVKASSGFPLPLDDSRKGTS